jgi:YidC/Oxa1 family membrane protein insertase
MDRRTIIAIVASLGIYYAWLAWRGPQTPTEPVPEPDPAALASPTPPSVVPSPVALPEAPAELVPLTACGTTYAVNTVGGAFTDVVLTEVPGPYEVTPIYQWVLGRITGSLAGGWLPYGPDPGPAQILTNHARAVEVGVGPASAPVRFAVASRDAAGVTLEGRTPEGLAVRHEVRVGASDDVCVFDVHTTFSNPSDGPITATASWSLYDHTSRPGSRGTAQHQPTALVDGSLYYGGALGAGCVRAGTQLSDDSGPLPLPGPVSWMGFSDRYFGFFLVPSGFGEGAALHLERQGAGDDALDGSVLAEALTVAAGQQVEWTGKVYAGENHVQALTTVDPSLDRVVDLGWFAMFGYPLLLVMRLIHGAVSNWGLAIIGVTVLLKAIFFPLTWRAMKSGQVMQTIQPEIARLKERYADDPAELNRQTLELMSKNGANPLSGCWPMLVQMPVFMALYNVLLTNVEFYQEPFLYLRDLSSPDPYCGLPLAVTALMWGQQQMTPTPENMDPAQQAVLKWMPLMFGLFFFTSPSGLAIYVFVNVSLSIMQQWLIKRSLGAGQVKAPVPAGR